MFVFQTIFKSICLRERFVQNVSVCTKLAKLAVFTNLLLTARLEFILGKQSPFFVTTQLRQRAKAATAAQPAQLAQLSCCTELSSAPAVRPPKIFKP